MLSHLTGGVSQLSLQVHYGSAPTTVTSAKTSMGVVVPDGKLFFLHIPRTAGTTMHSILMAQYGFRKVYSIYDAKAETNLGKLPKARLEQLKVVTGHFVFGIHERLSEPYAYGAILRDPVARVISAYSLALRDSDPRLMKRGTGRFMSLQEYVESGVDGFTSNAQTKTVSGMNPLPYQERSTELNSALDKAKSNLSEHFALIGLTEWFDESILLFKLRMNWNIRNLIYIKRMESRVRQVNIGSETLEFVKRHNRYDLELYDHAKRLFKERLLSEQDLVRKELPRLRLYLKYLAVPRNIPSIGIRSLARNNVAVPIRNRLYSPGYRGRSRDAREISNATANDQHGGPSHS